MNIGNSFMIFVSAAVCFHCSDCLSVDVSSLASKIDDLMNKNLGVKFIQDHYNKQGYDVTQLQGHVLLDALKNALIAKTDKVRNILMEWKQAIEEDYAKTTAPIGDDRDLVTCCSYPHPVKFNYQFEREVDMNGNCELTSFNADPKNRNFRRLNLKNMKEFTTNAYKRLENKGLYIYYGQKDGYYLQFPGMMEKTEDCSGFDTRTRPWYVSAATQKSKDVVVLVDVSKNIDKKIFKELVETFLKTMDPRDKVAVIPFAERLFLNPDHCFSTQLVSASPANRLAMTNFVNSAIDKSSSGQADYNIATYKEVFEEAFKKFPNGTSTQEKLIFLVTSGTYSDQEADVMRAIFNGNKQFSFKVVIGVFAIKPGMSDKKRKFHQNIADQNCVLYLPSECSSSISPPKGKFVHVSNSAEMRNNVGGFYDFLSEEKSKVTVRYSFPYMDFFGSGVLIATSIPTYKGSTLMGVASIDLVVSELLSEVEYFKEGHNAYRFLIGSSGFVYQHPLLPKPVLAFEPTVPVDISLLERGDDFPSVRKSMINGESGQQTLLSYQSMSRGDSSLEGAIGVAKNYTFYWKAIPMGSTNFSLAVVIEASNSNQYELKDGTVAAAPMIYHRLDRIGRGPQYKFCRLTKYLILKDRYATKLPGDAFGSAAKYYVQETVKVVDELMKYFSSNTKASPDLLQSQTLAFSIRKSIHVTSVIDTFWNKTISPYVAWRYIATEDGVFTAFPGAEMHPLYDPRSRPWYQRSLIYPNTAVISTPYFDSSAQTPIITFSHLIQRTLNDSHTNVAVMGLDLSMYFFKSLILDNVSECRNRKSSHICVVVDKSGLIVYHPDFTDASVKQNFEGQHITTKVPDVASDLVKDKHLRMESCIGIYKTNKSSDYAKPHIQYFYVLDVDRTISKTPNALNECPQYSLVPVPKTNVYLLIVHKECLQKATCSCQMDGTCKQPLANFPCHCPCKHFLTCDEYLTQVSTKLVCPPLPFDQLLPVKTKEEEAKEVKEAMTYPRCNDPKCKNEATWDKCNKIGCQWCFLDANGKLISESKRYCDYSETCPLGKRLPVKMESSGGDDDTNILAIILPIVLVLLLILVVLVLVFLYRSGRLPTFKPRKKDVEKRELPHVPNTGMNFAASQPNEISL